MQFQDSTPRKKQKTAMGERQLHVFEDQGGENEMFVAYDIEDCWKAAAEMWGEETVAEYRADDDGDFWTQLPDDQVLNIDASDDGDGSNVLKLTCAEWCKREGRGYLCGPG